MNTEAEYNENVKYVREMNEIAEREATLDRIKARLIQRISLALKKTASADINAVPLPSTDNSQTPLSQNRQGCAVPTKTPFQAR
jgi:hypothetical protein